MDGTVNGQDVDGSGLGGWLGAHYAYRAIEWLTPHAYSAVLVTAPFNNCGLMIEPCDVSTKILLVGAKIRLSIPLPGVAPFLEPGIGASAGTMSTKVGPLVNKTRDGVLFHIPLALGLAVGSSRQYELVVQVLYHPQARQMAGASTFGLTFPFR